MSKALKQKTLNDLEANDCRWPIGDPRHPDFHLDRKSTRLNSSHRT